MIAGPVRYRVYKESGAPWLEQIPDHWELAKIKNLAGPGRKTFVDGDWIESPYITSEGVRLIQTGNIGSGVYREKGYRYVSHETFDSFKCTEVMPNDVLICRLGHPVGRACIAPDLGVQMITSVDVCILKSSESVQPAFIVYAMSAPRYLDWVGSLVRGSTRDRVSRSMLGGFALPLPPYNEQSSIVRFLDHVDGHIGRYIKAKRKLIALLEEQRATTIQQLVTHGLDKAVPAKPSGLQWLGEVPAHWDVKPVKRYFREIDDRSSSGSEELLSVSHLTGVTPRSEKNITMFMAESYAGHKLCEPDDLVINTMWAWMAALGVSQYRGIVSPAYAVYRPLDGSAFRAKYIDYLLRTTPYIAEYICRSTGIRSSRLRLYPEQFLRIPLLCPPLEEQDAILTNVAEATNELDAAISSARREILLLREYRARLINDVTTGAVDVSDAAKTLPSEPEGATGAHLDEDLYNDEESETELGIDDPADEEIGA